jgi:ferredoxin hydrogenase
MSIHENSDVRVPINKDSLSIKRDDTKCVLCGNCRSTCKFSQGVYGRYDLEKTNDYAICIECGQCSNVCPTSAICEVKDYLKLKKLIKNEDYVFVFQTAPAVRVALGEEFGLEAGSFVQGKLVTALKKLGANYVLDTAYGADLTIMEEANELLERLNSNKNLPMFTSCCPAWVKFAELFYPEYINNLSTCKSPILMQGAIIKTYFAKQMNIEPKKIINVAVTPCTAKKYEIKREEMNSASKVLNEEIRDMDFIITTRELASWLKEEKIDFNNLEDSNYDSLLGEASGAGIIFGSTGGVMEATLRTAHFYITGKKLEDLEFKSIRGLDGIKEAKALIGNSLLSIAVINGTNNVHKFIELLKKGTKHYDFIEVMACQGGCIAGGGQPKLKEPMSVYEKEKRISSLYLRDSNLEKRCSYENSDIQKLYNYYLTKPGSKLSETLLHTTYSPKDKMLHETDELYIKV